MNRLRHFTTGMLVASGVLPNRTVHEGSWTALDIAGLERKVSRIRKDHVGPRHPWGLEPDRVRVTLGSHPLYLVGTEGGRAGIRIR